jgi:large subunit ribosomal protein L24
MAFIIRKNDMVQVMRGKDAGRIKEASAESRKPVGRRGRVLTVDRSKGMAIVEGLNIAKKHEKPNPRKNVRGGIVDKPMPLPLSALRLVCPKCGPVRMKLKRTVEEKSDNRRRETIERLCVKCGHNFG